MRSVALIASIIMVGLATTAIAQIPASFQVPMLGYIFDAENRVVRPITGIAGSSTIGAPIPLPFTTDKIEFLPDQRHAIVSSSERPEPFVLNLRELNEVPIRGAFSAVTAMRVSSGGSAAALYYATIHKVFVVTGIPTTPVIQASIDISFSENPLRQFAISNDGTSILMSFSSNGQDALYTWSPSVEIRYVSTASRVSDITFVNEDAVVLDSDQGRALWIRNVREQALPTLVASAEDGLSKPVAVFLSSRNEIYIGDASGTVVVLDSTGHILRKVLCSCSITTMAPLANSALRLTDRLDQPVFILDGSESDRFLFIPAFTARATQEGRQ